MAADYLTITRTNRPMLGTQLIRAANLTKELRELIDGINDVAQHQFDGGDYSLFESQFGIATGQGANRLAQLDEFVGRLSGQ